jgi:hypothetical protein
LLLLAADAFVSLLRFLVGTMLIAVLISSRERVAVLIRRSIPVGAEEALVITEGTVPTKACKNVTFGLDVGSLLVAHSRVGSLSVSHEASATGAMKK